MKKFLDDFRYRVCSCMSFRCRRCPFAGSDWSSYNDTGYIGPKCELHSNNECDGCLTPFSVILIKHLQYKNQEKKALEYESQMLRWEKAHQDEINQIISDSEDDRYRQYSGD